MAHITARELASPPFEDVYVQLALAGSPRASVEYNYVGKQSIPTTGLSPASPTALWAADPDRDSFRPPRSEVKNPKPQGEKVVDLELGPFDLDCMHGNEDF